MEKKAPKNTHPKKDLKARFVGQLHTMLESFKETVNEKKIQKLVKKASKLLADGLHHKPVKAVKKKAAAKAPAKKTAVKKVVKKAVPQKAAPKKVAAKKTAKKK